MTDESNYSIAFAPLSDWPKKSRVNFSTNEKQKQKRFYPRFEQVPGNCKEF